MSTLDKLKKNSRVKEADIMSNSAFFGEVKFTSTAVPMINVALSGSLDGGLTGGITVLAGPSKHFKTSYALLMAASYLDKHKDACLLFYDSEFGSPQSYFESFGIDTSRVLHTPVKDAEELKFDLVHQLELLDKKDNVIIILDSMGNLSSKKELQDAKDEKSVQDMSRAKAFKGLFRMITPYLKMKDIPFLVVNHTYMTIEMFSKPVVSGGCVVAGTQITLADGTTKAVEDFIVGDKVSTLDGPKEVTHIWNPNTLEDGNPDCYEVEFEDGHKVICSDAHEFLIDGEWVEAKDLILGQLCETI